MLTLRLAAGAAPGAVLALPVARRPAQADEGPAAGDLIQTAVSVPDELAMECAALCEQVTHTGRAGQVHGLPRPLGRPRQVYLAGVGDGTEAAWRAAGAAIARAAVRETAVTVALPGGADPVAVRGVAEGLLLGSYRFRLGTDDPASAPRLRRATVAVDDPARYAEALAEGRVVAEATAWARDLTNTPSLRKNPSWFARQVEKAAAAHTGLRLRLWDQDDLRQEGFGGILAVGAGSASPPRLVELSWRPRGAGTHVVLVGKGVTFDTGGVSIKPASAMTLMRKDMAGAAAVVAALIGAARMDLAVGVTALAPLAENMVSGSAMRPADVVRHWGGKTSEIRSTDAEGRLMLADVLAYAAQRLHPDHLVDVATLTGANAVALGKRTGALYCENGKLASELEQAAGAAGEQVWRMPLPDDYVDTLRGEVADLFNSPSGPGSVIAALYLREFVGDARDRWAHIDMSAPSWIDRDEGEMSCGATGWGVRTLLRWLATLE